MHQRKDKIDRPSQHEALLNLLPLLETPDDDDSVETIKNLIYENLSGSKDSRLLYDLVDYYMAVESHRSLDILLHLKEPHDKFLFDRISDLIKNETHRYKSLQLLCNLVYRQPSWLYKIATHRIMHTLLNLLKTDVNAPNLMSGLFILICFLPMIPSQFGPYLRDTFDIFSRLAAWSVKKPSFIVDIYMVHLQIAIYTLFHRLYGMFPCHFLAYLRSYYGGSGCNKENYQVFSIVIKPMLERVRLHPLLVTASKETELSPDRWKKMSYHDIIVECASISLDAIEGTAECMRRKNLDSLSSDQNVCSYESAQFFSYSSQSSCSVNFESESVLQESVPLLESIGTVMQNPMLSTPPPSSSATSPQSRRGELEYKSYKMQLSTEEVVPLDFAIEAKPELMKMELDNSNVQALSLKSTASSSKGHDKGECKSEATCLHEDESILQGVEAKEDDVDKEVCELTSRQDSPSKSSDVRHDTPFCSTTQNLTDDPRDLSQKMSFSGSARSDSLTKSTGEENEETYNSLQDGDTETFSPPYSRFRFFSHCQTTPDTAPACYNNQKKQKVARSLSCPANLDSAIKTTTTSTCICDSETSKSVVVTCSTNSSCATTSAVSASQPATYENLIPMALQPLPDARQSRNYDSFSINQMSLINSLSPPELLDRYIQLGNLTSLGQLGSIPITSTTNTDWTHFGGKPPQDEITILRNQILLLHSQLLFERHRKDVHSERNRRILGRAKRFRMQEEHIVALKEQISLLEQDNRGLKNQIEKKSKQLQLIQVEKQQVEADLLARILKAEQDNLQLQFSNKHLQNLLVSQKRENDEIIERCKAGQAEITILNHQVELANKKAQQCQIIEKESVFLTKQLILLQELIGHYKEKVEMLKDGQKPDYGGNILNDAACAELKELKQNLDAKAVLLDAMKTKAADLEKLLSNMKTKHKEQMQAFEVMKSLHRDEIIIREERISDLKKISAQKDVHILRLYSDMETYKEEKRKLENQRNGCIETADCTSLLQCGQNAGACSSHQCTESSAVLDPNPMGIEPT